MSTQPSTEPLTDNPNGVAPARVVDESDLTPELIERVGKLSQAGLIKLSELIDSTLDDGELIDTSALPQPSREEIQRRLNSIVDGTAVSYTVQETMVHLRSRTWREGQS